MTNDIALCPSAFIKVGATPTPLVLPDVMVVNSAQPYHLFIWYHDGNRDIIYRGGPENGSRYEPLVNSGSAELYSEPRREVIDLYKYFGRLVTNRMVGLDGNYDYETWVNNGTRMQHMLTIAEGPEYCGLDDELTRQTRRVGALGRVYNPAFVPRVDNSNATVYTILEEMNLPLEKPDIWAPGWGTNLHRTQTLVERIMDPISSDIARYQNASQLDQIRLLHRMFGGR